MSYKDWYTINQDKQDFICVAVDKDMNFQKQYRISGGTCECVVGHTWCRHKKMVKVFQQKELIGKRRYYNFDKEKWLPEVKHDD